MAVGDKYNGDMTSWTDPEFGYRIIKPIAKDGNRQMYFTSNPFTSSGQELVFSAVRDGTENFYLLNYYTGEYIQLTDRAGIAISRAYYDRAGNTLYYAADGSKVYATNIGTLNTRLVYEGRTELGTISVTCDGRYLVASDTIDKELEDNDGNPFVLGFHRMFSICLATGEENTILYRAVKIDHIQCSPSDPNHIVYCEWGKLMTHHRIWHTNLSGTSGGPLGNQQPNESRTHEYYTKDGGNIAFHAKTYTYDNDMKVKNQGYRWGIMNADGSDEKIWRCLPKGQMPGHSTVSFDGTKIACDGNGYLSLLERCDDGTAYFRHLVKHDSTECCNFVHPHPSFSPDDKYIVYATDCGGADSGNIYLIKLY